MHPYLTDQLVRDHLAGLELEASQHRLAKAASAATAAGRASRFMPHVQEGRGLRRAIVARLRPSPA
jgi:hypothetical protein